MDEVNRYLSYPALYTHIKQKHGGQDPPGTQSDQKRSSRGRGRPRKIYIAEDIKSQQERELEADQQRKLERDNKFLQKFNANGGPTDPSQWFTSDNLDQEEEKTYLQKKVVEMTQKLRNYIDTKADDAF